mmetsp:Transcript_40959/g.128375  ORF Transcript_40959/g.128375 Transcript_40959/m.128375 type:complete len:124 (-) Transcript_40959:1246-1617(-)
MEAQAQEAMAGMGGMPSAEQLQQQQAQMQEMQEQRTAILEQVLEPEARSRLNRIKLVREEKAISLENQIISMATSGKIKQKINEELLIKMLEGGGQGEKKTSVKFQRRNYFDDDDDDNDDDLL